MSSEIRYEEARKILNNTFSCLNASKIVSANEAFGCVAAEDITSLLICRPLQTQLLTVIVFLLRSCKQIPIMSLKSSEQQKQVTPIINLYVMERYYGYLRAPLCLKVLIAS